MRTFHKAGLCVLVCLFAAGPVLARPGPGRQDETRAADQATFAYLLSHHEQIRRTVTPVEKGVVTVTESDDAEVAAKIREHVEAMHRRVKEGRGIHLRDPLFAALFARAKLIQMQVDKTDKGVKVTETSDDPYTAKLIQLHAAVVSQFVAVGHAEVRKNHEPPPEKASDKK